MQKHVEQVVWQRQLEALAHASGFVDRDRLLASVERVGRLHGVAQLNKLLEVLLAQVVLNDGGHRVQVGLLLGLQGKGTRQRHDLLLVKLLFVCIILNFFLLEIKNDFQKCEFISLSKDKPNRRRMAEWKELKPARPDE